MHVYELGYFALTYSGLVTSFGSLSSIPCIRYGGKTKATSLHCIMKMILIVYSTVAYSLIALADNPLSAFALQPEIY